MTPSMKTLLILEEAGQFFLSIFLFSQLDYAWWVFPLCILLPDLSMVGYLFNPKAGALIYNFFHHKLIGIGVFIAGFLLDNPLISLAGIILFGHSSMDRAFGYGLKFNTGFKHTHLGTMGPEE